METHRAASMILFVSCSVIAWGTLLLIRESITQCYSDFEGSGVGPSVRINFASSTRTVVPTTWPSSSRSDSKSYLERPSSTPTSIFSISSNIRPRGRLNWKRPRIKCHQRPTIFECVQGNDDRPLIVLQTASAVTWLWGGVIAREQWEYALGSKHRLLSRIVHPRFLPFCSAEP